MRTWYSYLRRLEIERRIENKQQTGHDEVRRRDSEFSISGIMFFQAYQAILLPIFAEAVSQEVTKMSSATTRKSKHPTKTTVPPEEQVKEATAACLDYWCQTNSGDQSDGNKGTPNEIHKECSVLSLLNGSATCTAHHEGGTAFSLGVRDGEQTQEERYRIMSIKILPVGSQNAAAVHVSISDHFSRSSNAKSNAKTVIHGWLTLLKSPSHKPNNGTTVVCGYWTCIAAAFSNASTQILPFHFSEVTALVWDGYCKANRACDGAAMAQVFHPTCRLTYAQDTPRDDTADSIVVCPQPQFCNKVQYRYTANEPMHAPYAKLQSHPEISQHDALLGIEFVTQNLCMVTLRVGHPPCLWTDLLTCCKLEHRWWIVHKSSCHENYELTEDMQAILDDATITFGKDRSGSCNAKDPLAV